MTDQQKRKHLEKHKSPVICPGCGKTIYPDDDLRCVEYVRTKRRTDVFFHRECMDKVWRPESEG